MTDKGDMLKWNRIFDGITVIIKVRTPDVYCYLE